MSECPTSRAANLEQKGGCEALAPATNSDSLATSQHLAKSLKDFPIGTMFRIVTASTSAHVEPSTSTRPTDAMEDILMEEEFGADGDGTGPSRAQAVGGGRVTGPGEAIADSGKWMR